MAKGNMPTFNVRAKTGRKTEGGDDIFTTVGAAWEFKNGTGYSVKINSLPVPFDGTLIMVEPKDD